MRGLSIAEARGCEREEVELAGVSLSVSYLYPPAHMLMPLGHYHGFGTDFPKPSDSIMPTISSNRFAMLCHITACGGLNGRFLCGDLDWALIGPTVNDHGFQ